MNILQQFCDAVEAHIVSAGINPTAFGKEALKDPSFVFELRAGREPALKTIEKVQEYMLANRPAAAAESIAESAEGATP